MMMMMMMMDGGYEGDAASSASSAASAGPANAHTLLTAPSLFRSCSFDGASLFKVAWLLLVVLVRSSPVVINEGP